MRRPPINKAQLSNRRLCWATFACWTHNSGWRGGTLTTWTLALLSVSGPSLRSGVAQTARRPLEPAVAPQANSSPHRTRLILKNGSYQSVLSYQVKGDVVRYRSAERNGEQEELPLALVDLPATQAWESAHDPASAAKDAQQQPSVLSPELAREEAAKAARTPEVAKDLR